MAHDLCERCGLRAGNNSIGGTRVCGLCMYDMTGGQVQSSGSGGVHIGGDGRGGVTITNTGVTSISGGNIGRPRRDRSGHWSDRFDRMMADVDDVVQEATREAGRHGANYGILVTGGSNVVVENCAVGDGATVINHRSGDERHRRRGLRGWAQG